jgi:predicted phosphoadenosine phosphosulfate sulfurtransferase
MQSLYTFQQAWPHLWDKMVDRVEGAKAAARYSRTELYSFGKKPKRNKLFYPLPMDFIVYLVKKHPEREQKKIAKSIKWLVSLHNKQTKNKPIPESELDPRTGISWELLYMIALRGDLKDRAYNLAVTNARMKSGERVMAPRKQSTKVK